MSSFYEDMYGSYENKNDEEIKQGLLALIDGLTKHRQSSQFDSGEKYIDANGIKILKKTIKHMNF